MWERTGGPIGGLGYDVRMRPGDPNVMYVTDAWAGIHRSDDGGRNWYPINEGITTRSGPSGDAIPIFSLTIDPHDPDVIWVGTQNTRGIFKSTDAGLTWTEKVNGIEEIEGITFRGFTVHPEDPGIVYAAAELSSWVWSGFELPGREFDMTGGVVYKTIDGGEHWTAVWRGDNLARYVWIDPTDPEIVYLSTGIFDREAANSDPETGIPGGAGVLKSTDGGATWAAANQGLGNLYVGSLYMHPDDPRILLAATGNNQYHEQGGIYLSTDGAATWSHVLAGEGMQAVEFTSEPAIAYAGNEAGIFRSDDGGRTWNRTTDPGGWGPPGIRPGFPIDFQADPGDPDRVFVNNYGGGNFVSTDGGYTWEAASAGYTGAQTRDITVDPTAPGRTYAAVRSGLYVTDDGGHEWRGLGFGIASALEYHAVAVDPTDPLHLLAASNWTPTMLTSRDGGRTWDWTGPQLDESMAWRVIAFAEAEPSIVYAGSGAFYSAGSFSDDLPAAGVFVSRDGGNTWEDINTEVAADAQVAELAIHPEFVGFVYAASTTHGLLRTYDGGLAWERVTAGLPEQAAALAVAFDPHGPEVVLAGFTAQGLHRSADGGETWTRVAAGFNPESTITDIVFDPVAPGTVYVSDVHSGVYVSADAGLSWHSLGQGLRTRAVNGLALSADGAHLYAATEGEGVYRLDLSGAAPPPSTPLWAAEDEEPAVAPATSEVTADPSTADDPEESVPAPTAPAAAPTEDTGASGISWWLLGGGVGAVLLLGVLAALFRWRRA
jgi:photosystem II stability/assembly factor-like uncharacterized protein